MPTISNFPSVIIIAPTPTGYRLALSLQGGIDAKALWTKKSTVEPELHPGTNNVHTYSDSLATVVADSWHEASQFVFVLTVGAVVRLIAPWLGHKNHDPGVVVIDETGQFVVSVSGGHQGGADALARQCAALLGVTPVITSAAEGQNLPALDCLGTPYGWRRGSGNWTAVAAAITQGQPVTVTQTCGWQLWQQSLPLDHSFQFTGPQAPPTPSPLDGISQPQPSLPPPHLPSPSTPHLWISDRLPSPPSPPFPSFAGTLVPSGLVLVASAIPKPVLSKPACDRRCRSMALPGMRSPALLP